MILLLPLLLGFLHGIPERDHLHALPQPPDVGERRVETLQNPLLVLVALAVFRLIPKDPVSVLEDPARKQTSVLTERERERDLFGIIALRGKISPPFHGMKFRVSKMYHLCNLAMISFLLLAFDSEWLNRVMRIRRR